MRAFAQFLDVYAQVYNRLYTLICFLYMYILNSRWSRLLLTKQWEKDNEIWENRSDCIRDETHNFVWLGTRRLPSQLQIVNWLLLDYMGVSKNRGTPKSSILIGFSIINHPFWGIPIFGNTHMGVWQSRRCIDQIRQFLSAAFAWSCLSSQTPDATFYHQRVQCLHMFCRWGDPVWSTEFSMHWLLRMEICWNIKPFCSRKSQTTSFRHIQHAFYDVKWKAALY